MAEQEVIKHTKKIYKVWNSKEHSLWHKLKEFFVEVFIIVFAVSLSIWFHNRSEHANQQEDVKQFLLGLKSDLQSDLKEMQNDKQSYLNQKAIFTYISNAKLDQPLSKDTLNKYSNWMFNETALNPNNGRFEGFKSSGKIGTIENRELQNDIMDLYQEDIVILLASTSNYIAGKRKFFDYWIKNGKRINDSSSNLATLLLQDEGHNLCASLSTPNQAIERYDTCIVKMKKIIAEIDKEYNPEN
jgi:hypothetical protein